MSHVPQKINEKTTCFERFFGVDFRYTKGVFKMTEKQRQLVDTELENFVHRLVFANIATYDEIFKVCKTDELTAMRQAKLEFDK